MKNKITAILSLVLLVGLDQISKVWAKTWLQVNGPVDVIKGVFSFEYLENTGIAFGMFKGKFLFFVVLTIVILIGLIYAYIKIPNEKKYRPLQIAIVILAAGAIGNMIDRIVYKFVVDFLYFNLIDFPVFNLADCYVTVSVAILFVLLLFIYKEEDLSFIGKKKEGNEKE